MEPKGNLTSPQKAPAKPIPGQHLPTYWQAVYLRFLAVVLLLVAIHDLVVGRFDYRGLHFTRQHDPGPFYFCVGAYLYLACSLFFHAPFHRWVFSLELPSPPPEPAPNPDEYKDYVRPPKPIGRWKTEPVHLSDFYEPAFIKSLLLVVCAFGVMATLCGVMQLIVGTVYVPHDRAFEIYTLKDDGVAFFGALVPYAVIGIVTLFLSIGLYYWRPVGRAARPAPAAKNI